MKSSTGATTNQLESKSLTFLKASPDTVTSSKAEPVVLPTM